MKSIELLGSVKVKNLKKRKEPSLKPDHIESSNCEPLVCNQNDFIKTKTTTTPKLGWGACSACDCRGFMSNPGNSNDYVCYDCGHHWSLHS